MQALLDRAARRLAALTHSCAAVGAAVLVLGPGPAVAAPAAARAMPDATPPVVVPSSVTSLFDALPTPPASAEEAARWVDRQGRVVHPGVLALQAAIEAHRQAVGRIRLAQAQVDQEQAAIAAEGLTQGIAAVGIDMERLQRDPAYQREVQARMQRMSPQEMMAMSQRMNAPLNRDPRRVNEAQAMVQDPPAVRAAADAGWDYAQGQPQRLAAQTAQWQQTEEAAKRVQARKLTVAAPRPALEWENIGCDAGCRAQWQARAGQMLPLLIARESEILDLRAATWQRQRAALQPDLATADRHLQASQFGQLSRSQGHQARINGYDAAAVAEVEHLLNRLVDMARSAAVVPHCGPQIVLAPGAVCS